MVEERALADEEFEAAILQCGRTAGAPLEMLSSDPVVRRNNNDNNVSDDGARRTKRRLNSTTTPSLNSRQSSRSIAPDVDAAVTLPSPKPVASREPLSTLTRRKRSTNSPYASRRVQRHADDNDDAAASSCDAASPCTSKAKLPPPRTPPPPPRTPPPPAPSPSPATAQRLFSARRKREIVKAKRKEVNENGETPLHVAARRGQADKVQRLAEAGAETNTKGKDLNYLNYGDPGRRRQ